MIDLVLVKKNMLYYVQAVRAEREIGRGLSDHYVVLYKIRLVKAWIKGKEVVFVARRIRSEKLREDWYARSLEGKRVEGDGENVEHIWEQVKLAMNERAREVCVSVRVRWKNPKSLW